MYAASLKLSARADQFGPTSGTDLPSFFPLGNQPLSRVDGREHESAEEQHDRKRQQGTVVSSERRNEVTKGNRRNKGANLAGHIHRAGYGARMLAAEVDAY